MGATRTAKTSYGHPHVDQMLSWNTGRSALAHAIAGLGKVAYAFRGLPMFSFDLIMADPSWLFAVRSPKGHGKSPEAHYKTMPIAAIQALPVPLLAAPNCALVLWGTFPKLLDRQHPSLSPIGAVIEAWGFRYASGASWTKTTVNDKVAFGAGYVVRSACEPYLIALMGRPVTSRRERNLIETTEPMRGLRREHSRKPETAYAWCERNFPEAKNRLDLFSRRSRPGWTAWGDECGKFDNEEGG